MIFKRLALFDIKDEKILNVIDIGSSKVACFIAKLTPVKEDNGLFSRKYDITILGEGVSFSSGIEAGVVCNMKELQDSIKEAVSCAEEKAGIKVKSVLLSINGSNIKSRKIKRSFTFPEQEISQELLNNLVLDTYSKVKGVPLYCVPISYLVDGSLLAANPIEMICKELTVNFQVLEIDKVLVNNIIACFNKAYLDLECIVAAPLSSSLAVLRKDDADAAICIDIGYATTSCSVFKDKKIQFMFSIAYGSKHITKDIAKIFGFDLEVAEEQKCNRGLVDLSVKGKNLTTVITARVEEILSMIKKDLIEHDKNILIGKKIILTGGGSGLSGLAHLSEQIFALDTEVRRPLGIRKAPSETSTGAYSAVLCLFVLPQYVQMNNLVPEMVSYKTYGTKKSSSLLTYLKYLFF